MSKRIAQACIGLLAALLPAGCTYSDSLRVNEIRSVWGPATHALAPVPVFYATDREPDGRGGFSLHWGGVPRCGKADVAVTNALSPPTPDPTLAPIACNGEAAMAAFAGQIAAAAKARGCDRVLLIVHGYNVSFRSALLHGAQNARDTEWRCATLLLNWSSEARFNRYAADIERSSYAIPLLVDLLRELKAAGLQTDILSHSLGARIALIAVDSLCPDRQTAVGQFILAAADISVGQDNDDFARLLERAKPCTRRFTVYASRNDLALILSENVHGGIPRAGRVPAHDMRYEGPQVDVVDASDAPGDSAGHAYFIFSWEMAKDIMWVLAGAGMAERVAPDGPHTLRCEDWNGSLCAAGGRRYSLRVAKDRRPGLTTDLLRDILPITPVQ
jgi:esterase/lipase superfamily enzyme